MKWAHLPNAGGIYDQHPQLLLEWNAIFAKQAEKSEREAAADKAKSRRGMGPSRSRR